MNEIAGRRVGVYARHSKDEQARSVPAQLDRCREIARQHRATVVEEFADEGITGAIMLERPAIMALLRAAAYRDFEFVLIEDLSRVSRDQADVATIYKRLLYHGVLMWSVTEGPINELHIGLKGTMNALYLRDLSDKVRRGQHAAVAHGGMPGGRRYGYDLVLTRGARGLCKINETEAAIVRRIFAEVAAGRPFREVARALNADGIPSTRGSRWHASTLVGISSLSRGILRNPIYRGRIVFGRVRNVRNPLTGRIERHSQPESEWKIVEVPELAIVPPEQWDAVQAIIGTKQPGRKPVERPKRPSKVINHITSGRLWCGDCGGRVTTAHSGYLVCTTWKTTRTCKQRHMFRRPEVIEALARLLASTRHAKSVHTAASAEAEVRRHRFTCLNRELAAVERTTASRVRSDAALGRSAEAHPACRRAIQDLAIPEAEFDALANRITTTRTALDLIATQVSVDAIAAAAHARIAAAARTLSEKSHEPDPQQFRLLDEVIDRITAAYRDGDRKRLTITVTLSPPAVYELGVQEIRWQDG